VSTVSGIQLGPDHPSTITARSNLASAYWLAHTGLADRADEAIAIDEQVADARERILGADHSHTLTARAHLAQRKTQSDEESPSDQPRAFVFPAFLAFAVWLVIGSGPDLATLRNVESVADLGQVSSAVLAR
jgi:hypothetical protein